MEKGGLIGAGGSSCRTVLATKGTSPVSVMNVLMIDCGDGFTAL